MSRDYYESKVDLQNEKIVASFYLARRGDKLNYDGFAKLPVSYGVDYIFTRAGNLRCWAEVKCRPAITHWGKFPTVMLSVLKWESGVKHHDCTGRAFRVLIRAGDGTVAVYRFKDEDRKLLIEWGGRTVQRRDNADVEPVVMIPIEKFVVVGNLADSEMV